jgi:hypothetical protein
MWRVPFTGRYRVRAGSNDATHHWFQAPLAFSAFMGPKENRFSLAPETMNDSSPESVEWRLNGQPVHVVEGEMELKKGDVLLAKNRSRSDLGLFLFPRGTPELFQGRSPWENLDTDLFHFGS